MLARCGPIVRAGGFGPRQGLLFARPAGHGRRGLKGNPAVRFLCWIKAGGQVRPRPSHTAPQRGSVQGLPGFRTAPHAGITLGPLGSYRGSLNAQSPATGWLARGSGRGYGPKTAKMPPPVWQCHELKPRPSVTPSLFRCLQLVYGFFVDNREPACYNGTTIYWRTRIFKAESHT